MNGGIHPFYKKDVKKKLLLDKEI